MKLEQFLAPISQPRKTAQQVVAGRLSVEVKPSSRHHSTIDWPD